MKTPLTISHRRGDDTRRVWAKHTTGERVGIFIRRSLIPAIERNPVLWGAAIALMVSGIAQAVVL